MQCCSMSCFLIDSWCKKGTSQNEFPWRAGWVLCWILTSQDGVADAVLQVHEGVLHDGWSSSVKWVHYKATRSAPLTVLCVVCRLVGLKNIQLNSTMHTSPTTHTRLSCPLSVLLYITWQLVNPATAETAYIVGRQPQIKPTTGASEVACSKILPQLLNDCKKHSGSLATSAVACSAHCVAFTLLLKHRESPSSPCSDQYSSFRCKKLLQHTKVRISWVELCIQSITR